MSGRPRVLIEEWLPAAAIGVECMRERGSASALAPHTFLHVWWARRPLTASRAAILGSLLPAEFPRDAFERLLGFGRPGDDLVRLRRLMDEGVEVKGGFNTGRAFTNPFRENDLTLAHVAMSQLWGPDPRVIDPMAGGGSIPLEAARLGILTVANEYNPVACTVLTATLDYPLRFGKTLAEKARLWAKEWARRCEQRLAPFYPPRRFALVHAYVFCRTVPCSDTGHPTPLVPDWHLLKPDAGRGVVAQPVADRARGTWSVRIREIGSGAGLLREAPRPTYNNGKGISLFTDRQIPKEYIKAKAQQGEMQSALYAVVLKTPQGMKFELPEAMDLEAIRAAERELARLRGAWEQASIIPVEQILDGDQPGKRLQIAGIQSWSQMFLARQLLALGVMVEELRNLSQEVIQAEGAELGNAVIHLLALTVSKFANHNSILARFENTRQVIKGVFGRHGYEFHPTHAEMAPCTAGAGLEWAVENVLDAYEHLCELPRHSTVQPVEIASGSAISLPHVPDQGVTAVVVDPPYADNVQYAELADFFYVWLKRTLGYQHPEWFATYLCDREQEAVVNRSRHRNGSAKEIRARAHAFYQSMMGNAFREMHRILRDDGVLTVMFTHKKQEAWEALFDSLIDAGFTITATWPVKTESEHSLHQAKKNAAQSTVILVARKRPAHAGVGYFDAATRTEIRKRAEQAAARLEGEGLNAVDQLVGAFGPAMEVYSRYREVRTDTGVPVSAGQAIDEAADAVTRWRIGKLAARGLDGVEPEGQFVLLCWDVLQAAEFRFNEAKLLGHAAGMDVDQLVSTGLVAKSGEKVRLLSARERRREQPLEMEMTLTLFGPVPRVKGRGKGQILKVHPNDPAFRTALDACHALALRYVEAGGGNGGTGSARALVHRERWTKDSPVARLMEALVRAAPPALWREKGKNSIAALYPEFRAWHALLKPLFGIESPDWGERPAIPRDLFEWAQAQAAVTRGPSAHELDLDEVDEEDLDDTDETEESEE